MGQGALAEHPSPSLLTGIGRGCSRARQSSLLMFHHPGGIGASTTATPGRDLSWCLGPQPSLRNCLHSCLHRAPTEIIVSTR